MDNFPNIIRDVLTQRQLELSENAIEKFILYAEILTQWNKKINLTSIIEPQEIAIKHFADSLTVLQAFNIPYGAKVIDIGSGAGFPGIPIKIVRPDINLTLLDSLNKRINFLTELCSKINIQVKTVHARAEEAAKLSDFREKFDVVVSRAVAPLNILLEYCVPFAKKDGVFIALKGSKAEIELQAAEKALIALNTRIEDKKIINLIDKNDREIIIFRKISNTYDIYPRSSSKISKKPL